MSSNAQPSQNPRYFSNKNNTRAVAGTYDTSGLGESVRTLILQENLLNEEELDYILDPVNMTEPGISGKDFIQRQF